MTFQREQGDRETLKILLDREDLLRFDLTFAQLNYDHARTRRLISRLLSAASACAGFENQNGRLLIEAFPGVGGGCVFYFTPLEESPKKTGRSAGRPQVYFFADADAMLACMDRLSADGFGELPCSLYEQAGRYLLVVSEPDENSAALLCEYGRKCGDSVFAAAQAAEHGKLLASGAAVRIVSGMGARP